MAGPRQPRAEEAAEAGILQQQLDLFQLFRQQTLENINTVQSKIREIHGVEGKVTALACRREMLGAGLELLLKECLRLKKRNTKLKVEISQLSRENSSPAPRHGRIPSDIQQVTEQDSPAKSERETPPRSMKQREAKHLNFSISLQESSDTEQELQRDSETPRADRAYTESRLGIELQNARVDIALLKSRLASANRERRRLAAAVTDITKENQRLKEELQAYRQAVSRYELDFRKLAEERSPSADRRWPTENETPVGV